ncbi:hypothetical protein PR048_032562 [Dryococelus australis]|uniref:Uncharacterized protein n=1 Tax=Dryococelus australis TaxID=614101 RepID=A0ABQ9G6R0_9NEOP|nr:hypothetical protein PR048_032562 [Dryococelus australis]
MNGRGETGDTRENPPTNGIVRHDSQLQNLVTWPVIEPGSPWWKASVLTAQPPALWRRATSTCNAHSNALSKCIGEESEARRRDAVRRFSLGRDHPATLTVLYRLPGWPPVAAPAPLECRSAPGRQASQAPVPLRPLPNYRLFTDQIWNYFPSIVTNFSGRMSLRGTVSTLASHQARRTNWAQSPAGSQDFRKWESCRTMPLVGGSPQGSPVSPALSSRRCSIFTSITLIGSQDLAPMKVIKVNMEQRRNEGAGETGDPRENPPTNGIARHDSHGA